MKRVKSLEFRVQSLLLPLFVIFSLITLNSALITPVYAQPSQCPGYETDFGCFDQTNPAKFGAQIYNIGLEFIGSVALLFIVYGGYLILTSQGNIDQLQKGKSYIFYSIVGLILAVSGFAFYQLIARNVLRIPGFTSP